MITEFSVVRIPCCTKPLSKVALLTQNSLVNGEQAKLVWIQYWGYSRYVGSLLVGMGRRVVMLLVVGVEKCCGRLNCVRVCMGQRLNLPLVKLRILAWIMNRQTCSNCTYKLVLVSTSVNQCWEFLSRV